MTPLAKWNDPNSFNERLIWCNYLDQRYQLEVQREESGEGATLVIFDHSENDKVIFSEPTSLSYGAIFGPDVMDIELWRERGCAIIDSLTKGED